MALYKAKRNAYCNRRKQWFKKGVSYDESPTKEDGDFFETHFECVDGKQAREDGGKTEADLLKEKLDALGVDYHPRLGVPKLRKLVERHALPTPKPDTPDLAADDEEPSKEPTDDELLDGAGEE